jgi:hypothetical protein
MEVQTYQVDLIFRPKDKGGPNIEVLELKKQMYFK